MQLKVNEVEIPKKIDFNYNELKQELTEKVQMYETLVYTDDQIKQAKTDKANLNKLKKALNDERIRREREYMAPFNEFKAQINEIISIIDKPIAIIDKQVKEAEEQKKLEKAHAIEELFEEMAKPEWLKLKAIYNSKWLNATSSMKSIREEIESRLEQINNDLATLSNLPEFGFEATEVYKVTLDINKAVNEGKRLAEIQKRKEEQERLKAEAEARAKAEAAARAEEEKPKTEEIGSKTEEKVENEDVKTKNEINSQSVPEPVNAQWVSFSARLTIAQAKELKEFFDSRNIEFKAI
jgi:hypothetical protein